MRPLRGESIQFRRAVYGYLSDLAEMLDDGVEIAKRHEGQLKKGRGFVTRVDALHRWLARQLAYAEESELLEKPKPAPLQTTTSWTPETVAKLQETVKQVSDAWFNHPTNHSELNSAIVALVNMVGLPPSEPKPSKRAKPDQEPASDEDDGAESLR